MAVIDHDVQIVGRDPRRRTSSAPTPFAIVVPFTVNWPALAPVPAFSPSEIAELR
jgi:hypothetical protein